MAINPNAFVNPSADYRLLPFWIWNSTIEEGEIVRQIREMSEKGIGGFCLSTGPGLKTPYLSQVWFDRVRVALETAATFNLNVWIHDEHQYPGGISSGQVVLGHPQFIAHQLTFRETVVQGGQQVDLELPWAPVLSAIAVPLRRDRCLWEDAHDISAYLGANHQSGAFATNKTPPVHHLHSYASIIPVRRLFWKAPTGRWRVLVFLQEPSQTPGYPGQHIDRLNLEAVQHLHETTLLPYAQHFEDHLGATIAGVFTAETRPPGDPLPWSPALPRDFQERNGYDIIPCLPALITNFGANTARIRYDYFQILGGLQQRNDGARSAVWCAQRGLQYASNALTARTANRINIPIPGSDGGPTKVGSGHTNNQTSYRQTTRYASALAAQTGAERALSTLGHNAGWSLTLQDLKAQLDAQAQMGANFFLPRGLFYTLDGLRKHAEPPSIFHQTPSWKHFRLLSDYAGRLSYILSQGQRVADIALLEPVTSLWSHLAHAQRDWAYSGHDDQEAQLAKRLVDDWAFIINALNQMQRPFDSLDPAQLDNAKIVNQQLQIGKARYSVIVLPPISNLERTAFECLREFINVGGQVIALGLLPIEDIEEGPSIVEAFSRLTDMEPGRMIRDYTGHELGVHLVQRGSFSLIRTGGAVATNRGTNMLARLLDDVLPRRVIIQTSTATSDAIRYHHRIDDKQHIFFLSNPANTATEARIQIPMPNRNSSIEIWDLETGKRTPLPAECVGNQFIFNLAFERLQSHLLVVSDAKTAETDAEIDAETCETIEINPKGFWKVDPEEDNALRLDSFRMQLDPDNRGVKQNWHKPAYSDHRWAEVIPKPIFNQLRDLPDSYDLPFELADDDSARLKLPLICWYRTTFAADIVPSKLALVMDRSAIQGDFQVYINGSKLPSNAFRPTFRYDHTNVTCAVGRRVIRGKNVVAVRVEIANPNEGLLDALYLFGRFQTKSWRDLYPRLAPPLERGPIHDLDALGLSHYAGTVTYTRDMSFRSLPQTEQFALNLEKAFKDITDIVEVQINGHSLGVRAWAPYIWRGETAWLKKGKNRIAFRITNTASRLLTGQTFQTRKQSMAPVKI